MYWWYAFFGGTFRLVNCKINCQTAYSASRGSLSSKARGGLKRCLWMVEVVSPPFGTPLPNSFFCDWNHKFAVTASLCFQFFSATLCFRECGFLHFFAASARLCFQFYLQFYASK